MHFLKKVSLFIALLIFSNHVCSQDLKFGFTLNYAQSKNTNTIPFTEFKSKFTSSGNAGFFLEKKIGNKSSLGIEALWVQIEAKQDRTNVFWTGPSLMTGEPAGFSNDEYRDHFSYIGIPIYYKFHIKKLGIKAGIQPLLYLFGSSHFSSNGELNGQPYADSSVTKDIELNHDFGPKVGVDYALWNGGILRLDYYHGVKNMFSDNGTPVVFEGKNRQVSLGFNFYFQQKKESKSGD